MRSKILNLEARRGGDVQFLIGRYVILRSGLNCKPFRSTIAKAYCTVDSDSGMETLNLTVPSMHIDRSMLYIGTGFDHPSLHHHSYTINSFHTYFSAQIEIHIPHVTWSDQEVCESKIDHINVINPHSAKPKHVIVQVVGIKIHRIQTIRFSRRERRNGCILHPAMLLQVQVTYKHNL